MRFVFAIVSSVLAVILIGLGFAQRTILAGPDQVRETVTIGTGTAVTVIPDKTLTAFPDSQHLTIGGSETVFAAYGRTADVLAFVGKTTYTTVNYSKKSGSLSTKVVTGEEATLPNPAHSDLWLQEYRDADSLSFVTNVPKGISMIVVSDGSQPAPSQISIAWPLDNRSPWSGPLIVAGALLLIIGLFFYLWALIHLRRVRGPRRKPPKMPKVPRQRRFKVRAAVAPVRGRRAAHRMVAVLPTVLIGSLALTGCTSGDITNFFGTERAPSSSPSPSLLASGIGDAPPPAVSLAQAQLIVARVAETAAKADAEKNTDLLASRFEGPALELRKANYAIRNADANYPALPAIPGSGLRLTLPQQTDAWPRTLMVVLQNTDAKLPPIALVLVQHTPRENYKVQYAITLEAKATLPDVAPADIGAARLPPDTKLLSRQPATLAMEYGDSILHGTESKFTENFVTEGDSLRGQVGQEAKATKRAALPTTATIDFSNANGSGEAIAIATNKSGAIVAVSLNEIETVKPVEAGASVNPEGAVKTLSGLVGTVKGVNATYGDQLLFYVPPSTSGEKVRLLGYSQGLIAAKELQ